MKYLLVGLLLASLAGLEFLHEMGHGEGSAAALCVAPERQQDAVQELLLQHLKAH